MRREHLRAVIWPRQTAEANASDCEGRPVYRYAIVGMLVTDAPLEGLNVNQVVIDGTAGGLSYTLESLPKHQPARPLGDASDVLVSLDTILTEPET